MNPKQLKQLRDILVTLEGFVSSCSGFTLGGTGASADSEFPVADSKHHL